MRLLLIMFTFLSAFSFSSGVYAATCGGLNQKPCTIFQRDIVKYGSCDKNLKENFATGKCVPANSSTPLIPKQPRPDNCGHQNQPPCALSIHYTPCEAPTILYLGNGHCMTPQAIQLEENRKKQRPGNCGRQNQPPCVLSIFYTPCEAPTTLYPGNGHCMTPQAIQLEENRKKQRPGNCGRQNQPPCVLSIFYTPCEAPLLLQGGRCNPKPTRPNHCGHQDQPPCKLFIFSPPCEAPTSLYPGNGMCMTPQAIQAEENKKKQRPDNCGRQNQPPCVLSIFYTPCEAPLALHNGRCLSQQDVNKRPENCGHENQPPCAFSIHYSPCASALDFQAGKCRAQQNSKTAAPAEVGSQNVYEQDAENTTATMSGSNLNNRRPGYLTDENTNLTGKENTCVRSGFPISLAAVDHTNQVKDIYTDNCGWYGCRVAKLTAQGELALDHGSSGAYGRPEEFNLKKVGSNQFECLRFGDQVEIVDRLNRKAYIKEQQRPSRHIGMHKGMPSQFTLRRPLSHQNTYAENKIIEYRDRVVLVYGQANSDTSNCGWYGCRVLMEQNKHAIADHGSSGPGGKPQAFFIYPRLTGTCGKEGLPICKVTGETACQSGLFPDLKKNICTATSSANSADIAQIQRDLLQQNSVASRLFETVFDYLATNTINNYLTTGFFNDLTTANLPRLSAQLDIKALQQKIKTILPANYESMKYVPKSISIGVVFSGSVGIGASVEQGVAINIIPDQSGKPDIILYRTIALEGKVSTTGVRPDVDLEVVTSASFSSANDNYGESFSLSVSVDLAAFTLDAGISFSGNIVSTVPLIERIDSVSIAPNTFDLRKNIKIVGAEATLGLALSQIYLGGDITNSASWYGGTCGYKNQRPCHIIEHFPSCKQDQGQLIEDFTKHLCLPPTDEYINLLKTAEKYNCYNRSCASQNTLKSKCTSNRDPACYTR